MALVDFMNRLERVSDCGNGKYRAMCPAHDSKHRTQSLAIREQSDGTVLVKCFAGCDVSSIVKAVGLELRDLFPEQLNHSNGSKTPVQRAMWHAQRQALETLSNELKIVKVLLADLGEGVLPSERDCNRAAKAAQLIDEAVKCVLGK